jgi:DNA modification methylase
MPDSSINTCLTSPPYWGVRDYEDARQIGNEQEADQYVEQLVTIFRQIKRVLHPYGTAWLNVGDKYLNGIGTVGGQPPKLGWRRNKQLSLIPFRLALALQQDGWWIRNTMVWHKPNGMPISAKDRLANHWEPIFLLTRNEKYYFNIDPIRIPHKTSDEPERRRAERGDVNGKAAGRRQLRQWLNSPRHRATIDGIREIGRRPNAPDPVELASYLRSAAEKEKLHVRDIARALGQPYERVRHYFRTDRIGSRLPTEATWEKLRELLNLDGAYDEAMSIEYGDNVFRNHPNGRNPGDVQQFSVANTDGRHFATMPQTLATWCLSSSLPPDGICLDPFMGSGTTGRSAISLGGRFVGIDLISEYVSEFAKECLRKRSSFSAQAAE